MTKKPKGFSSKIKLLTDEQNAVDLQKSVIGLGIDIHKIYEYAKKENGTY